MDTRRKCEILAKVWEHVCEFQCSAAPTIATKLGTEESAVEWSAWSTSLGGPPSYGNTEQEALENLAAYYRREIHRIHAGMKDRVAHQEQSLAAKRATLIDLTMALDATEE
jgi:hypothetical protein